MFQPSANKLCGRPPKRPNRNPKIDLLNSKLAHRFRPTSAMGNVYGSHQFGLFYFTLRVMTWNPVRDGQTDRRTCGRLVMRPNRDGRI